MPRVKLHWRPTRDDHANLVTNLRLVARSLGAAGLRRVLMDLDRDQLAAPVAPAFHQGHYSNAPRPHAVA